MKFLGKEQKEQIGYSFIIDSLETITSFGMDEKRDIRPFKVTEKKELLNELENIEKMLWACKEKEREISSVSRNFMKMKDIRSSVKRCSNGETLDEVELFEIKVFSILIERVKDTLSNLNLEIDELELVELDEIVDLLDPEKNRIQTFYIYDNYSKKLKNIREKKREKEKEILKEKNEEKIKSLKNERLDFVVQEEEEELKIRTDLSEYIKKHISKFEINIKVIGRLDCLIAKAKLAIKYNGIKPNICDHMNINLKEAFNPQIVDILNKNNGEFTPVSIEIKNGTTIITGANMGGKTVTLKTIVLNLFLGQCGFFVYAKEAEFPSLDFIHFISDDMQSISKGLSTFGAEIIKLKEVVECAKRGDGFIALDEFARGTNPKEGSYLVKSVAKYLHKFNSISLISTHYDGVVQEGMEHYQVKGLKDVDFDMLKRKIDLNKTSSIDIIQQHMNYKLEKVKKNNAVPKDALNISILLGLEEEVVNIVKEYYSEEEKNEK